MYWLALPLFTAAAAVNSGIEDPIARCRSAHAGDAEGRIACLEAALRDSAGTLAGGRDRPVDGAGERTVQIVGVRYDRERRGVFTTASGERWREIEVSPKGARLDAGRSYAGRLERSIAGGYRLHVDGVRRMLKVERVE